MTKKSILKRLTKTLMVSGLAAILSVSGIVSYPAFAEGNSGGSDEIEIQGEYVPGEAIICIQPERADEKKIAARSAGLFSAAPEVESGFLMDVSKAAGAFSEEDPENVKLQGAENEKTVLKLVRSDDLSTEELIKLYSDKPGVVFAEPNYIRRIAGENLPVLGKSDPDEEEIPDFTKDQYAFGAGPGGIDVPDWNNDKTKTNADGVVVAVMDSGVDYDNPDIAPVMWHGGNIPALTALGGGEYGINTGYEMYKFFQENGESDCNNLTDKNDPKDFNGHGTHCAGIIAAAWNDFGVSGAANGAKIMAVKHDINDKGESWVSTNIEGYNYINAARLAGVNVRVVNCSFGGPGDVLAEVYCTRELGENGIVTVFSSGNDESDLDVTSDTFSALGIPSKIQVNSINEVGNLSGFSNYGKRFTHIMAPGEGIISTVPNTMKFVYPNSKKTRAVSDNEGTRLYEDYSSDDTVFKYEADDKNGTKIKIENGELKISGTDINTDDDEITDETVAEGGTNRSVTFTLTANKPLPSLPEGKKYSLIIRRRIKDKGTWYLIAYVKTKKGTWGRPGLTRSVLNTTQGESYPLDKTLGGEEVDLDNLAIRFVLYKKTEDEIPALQELGIDELWITDHNGYSFNFDSGTSMAAPAVVGEVAILSKAFPDDSAGKLAARVLAGARKDTKFSGLCITEGTANVRNSLNEDKYTPVVNDITADKDGLHVRGFFFGEKEKTEVTLEQGNSTFSTSDGSLNIKKIDDKGEEILLSIPEKLERLTKTNLTVTNLDKGTSFSRILTLNDPDNVLLKSGSIYDRIPIPEEVLSDLEKTYFADAFSFKGALYFLGSKEDNEVEPPKFVVWRVKDGKWKKPDSPLSPSGHPTTYDEKMVYSDSEKPQKVVFYDENGGKEIIDTKLEQSSGMDLYYDGKDLLLIDFEEDEEKEYVSRVYRLDPMTGKVTKIGDLENIYPFIVNVVHEERKGQPNRIYVVGKGYVRNGETIEPSDFVCERFTVDNFKPELLNDAAPEDAEFSLDGEVWQGFAVKDGIYLVGGKTIKENENGTREIAADNFFLSFSDPDGGFKSVDRCISKSDLFWATGVAGYNKAYFLSVGKEGMILSCADMETQPHYGDSRIERYSYPDSPLHRTTGEDIEKISEENAKYAAFDPKVNTTVVANTKADVKKAFSSLPEYDEKAKHRYKSDKKKIASVNKKGILSAKKRGEVNITCEQKVKGGSWQKIGEELHLYIQQPEMKKKETVTLDSTGLNAYDFLSKTSFSPTRWKSTKEKVATVDEKTGKITIHKAGKTYIIAEYDEGKNGSKKKYKTKLIVKKK